jgi:carbon-monoxide dehydrogenase medium subunit
MKPFVYVRPSSLAEAVDALAEANGDSRVLAGGQSLLLAMKDRLERPSALVSLQDVPEVRGFAYTDDGTLEIGAATTYRELEEASLREGSHEFLRAVAADVADVPVRRIGTVGGALCQADPAFDFPLAAVAAGAEVDLASGEGTRTLRVEDFLIGPLQTARQPGEVLTTIRFPAADPAVRFGYVKHRLRRFDSALVSVACLLSFDGNKITSARIACGAVGPTPLRLTPAEEVVVGNEVSDELALEAGARAAAEVEVTTTNPVFQASYRREVLPTILARALRAAANGRSE